MHSSYGIDTLEIVNVNNRDYCLKSGGYIAMREKSLVPLISFILEG